MEFFSKLFGRAEGLRLRYRFRSATVQEFVAFLEH